MDEVTDLENKKTNMIEQQKVLKKSNDKLINNLNNKTEVLTQKIGKKSEELDTIKEKITDIEALVGITPSLETEVDVRLQNIKFTGLLKPDLEIP